MSLAEDSTCKPRKVHSTLQMSGGLYRKKRLSVNLMIPQLRGLQQREYCTILKTLVPNNYVSDKGVKRILLRSYVFHI